MLVEFPGFLTEVKGELEIIKIILYNSSQSCLIRMEQIEDFIRNGIVKNAQNPKYCFLDFSSKMTDEDLKLVVNVLKNSRRRNKS